MLARLLRMALAMEVLSLMTTVVLSEDVRASAAQPFIDPFLLAVPGATILRAEMARINLQPVQIVALRIERSVGHVHQTYVGRFLQAGWEVSARAGDGRCDVFVQRGEVAGELRITPLPSGQGSLVLVRAYPLHLRPPAEIPSYRVRQRLEGIPVYPGVITATLIEEKTAAGRQWILLYEAPVKAQTVARFYQRHFSQCGWEALINDISAIAGRAPYRVHVFKKESRRVLISLKPREESPGTSVLLFGQVQMP